MSELTTYKAVLTPVEKDTHIDKAENDGKTDDCKTDGRVLAIFAKHEQSIGT